MSHNVLFNLMLALNFDDALTNQNLVRRMRFLWDVLTVGACNIYLRLDRVSYDSASRNIVTQN